MGSHLRPPARGLRLMEKAHTLLFGVSLLDASL
jgi:hypothetical protein